MKKRLITVLLSLILSSNIYASYFNSALEFPLGLSYGIIKGLDINMTPGSSPDPSFSECVSFTTLGLFVPTEIVAYYKDGEHFWGPSHTFSYQSSFVSGENFYTGFMWSISGDLCFNTKRFTVGAKTDLDLMFGFKALRINTGIAAGIFDERFYAAPKVGLEFDFNDLYSFVATYTEGRLFNIPLTRATLGFRFYFEE